MAGSNVFPFPPRRSPEIALARAVRSAAENGMPFEELLSRNPSVETRLLALALSRLDDCGAGAVVDFAPAPRRCAGGNRRSD